ncbi:MAG: polysaccharide deacetylase family protein [Caulobacteraceae bacterium]|nr:polysaccharide deacetylase family protein [Caulobacteraceae bacterium]
MPATRRRLQLGPEPSSTGGTPPSPAARPWARRRFALLAAVALTAFAGLASGLAAAPAPQRVAILVYHRFDPATPAPTTVTIPAFQGQLAWLARHHYRIEPLRTALAELDGAAPSGGPVAVITADDGHKSVYTELFPVIRAQRIPVTLFIYPSAISNAPYALTWAQLREMQASGLVDVESHTYWHPNFRTERRRLGAAAYQAFVDVQLQRSKAVIERELGKPVGMLAWPFGIVDTDLEAAARRAGYTAGFGYGGGPAGAGGDRLALPRIPVGDADRGDRFGARIGAAKAERAAS